MYYKKIVSIIFFFIATSFPALWFEANPLTTQEKYDTFETIEIVRVVNAQVISNTQEEYEEHQKVIYELDIESILKWTWTVWIKKVQFTVISSEMLAMSGSPLKVGEKYVIFWWKYQTDPYRNNFIVDDRNQYTLKQFSEIIELANTNKALHSPSLHKLADLYVRHPLQHDYIKRLISDRILSKYNPLWDYSSQIFSTYVNVFDKIVNHTRYIKTLQSKWTIQSITDIDRTTYIWRINVRWTITTIQKELCSLYGIHYLNENICVTDNWIRSSKKVYQLTITQSDPIKWSEVDRSWPESKSWDPLLFDFSIAKETYHAISAWWNIIINTPKLQKWIIEYFQKYANTWKEVMISFIRAPIESRMYFSDMDVIHDVSLSY